MKKLEVGEKYLTIMLFDGQVKLVAFKDKDKQGNQPDYKGNGVAVWISEKKAPKENSNSGL